jgi:hypothetical protein
MVCVVIEMQDDATRFVPRWTTKEAASQAKISVPSVRKYAQILEKDFGYQFYTLNEKGDRCVCQTKSDSFVRLVKLPGFDSIFSRPTLCSLRGGSDGRVALDSIPRL